MIVKHLTGTSCRQRRGNLAHKRHFDRGAAAVEMAFVLPILILLTFGIIDFSRVFNAEIQISQGAREGARIAALADGSATSYTKADVRTRVQLAAPRPAFSSTKVQVADVDIVLCPNTPKLASVKVTFDYQGILFSFTGTKQLSQTAVMICGG